MADMNTMVYDLSKALPNKLLNADGSITDFQGKLISPPNEINAEVYAKSKSTANKFMTENEGIKTYAEISVQIFIVVDVLPEVGEPNKIYLVPSENGAFDEYFWNDNNKWDKIGEVKIDLSNYPNRQEVTQDINTSIILCKEYTDEQIQTNIKTVLGGAY